MRLVLEHGVRDGMRLILESGVRDGMRLIRNTEFMMACI